ncbi:hypothetical protein, variant 1 [Aphanomyces astaci]|uniref:Uncharacterized protein n=1 Tax=Aphanomyces astaci TaxID=112090 RepID=W4FF27_APHAT|nr:hypothetical protein, variant 1 [Aphanomyces astaci]ETV65494.1 hypothetical protein, variant 1 [Aphanomyces astaci]|eukprot:XP_009844982.1 hypothetical protein, variant 1 [Aphanomyces astaci]
MSSAHSMRDGGVHDRTMDAIRTKLREHGIPSQNTSASPSFGVHHSTGKQCDDVDLNRRKGQNARKFDFDIINTNPTPVNNTSPSASSMNSTFGDNRFSPPTSPHNQRRTNVHADDGPKKNRDDSLDGLFLPTQNLAIQAESITFAPRILNLDEEEFVDAATFIKRTETPVHPPTTPSSPVQKPSFHADVDGAEWQLEEFFARRSRNLKAVEFGRTSDTNASPGDAQADELKKISMELNHAISTSAIPPSFPATKHSLRCDRTDQQPLASPRGTDHLRRDESFAKEERGSLRDRSTGSFPSFQAEHAMQSGPIHDARPFSAPDLSISHDMMSNGTAPPPTESTKSQTPHHDSTNNNNLDGPTVETRAVVDFAKRRPGPIHVHLNSRASAQAVVDDAIQSARSMPAQDRAAINWTGPIHPSAMLHHSLDAVVAVQAMMEATNVMQHSVSEVLRLRELAQQAVEAAVVSEAMAIADHCRRTDESSTAGGNPKAAAWTGTHDAYDFIDTTLKGSQNQHQQRLPREHCPDPSTSCSSPTRRGGRNEFSSSSSSRIGIRQDGQSRRQLPQDGTASLFASSSEHAVLQSSSSGGAVGSPYVTPTTANHHQQNTSDPTQRPWMDLAPSNDGHGDVRKPSTTPRDRTDSITHRDTATWPNTPTDNPVRIHDDVSNTSLRQQNSSRENQQRYDEPTSTYAQYSRKNQPSSHNQGTLQGHPGAARGKPHLAPPRADDRQVGRVSNDVRQHHAQQPASAATPSEATEPPPLPPRPYHQRRQSDVRSTGGAMHAEELGYPSGAASPSSNPKQHQPNVSTTQQSIVHPTNDQPSTSDVFHVRPSAGYQRSTMVHVGPDDVHPIESSHPQPTQVVQAVSVHDWRGDLGDVCVSQHERQLRTDLRVDCAAEPRLQPIRHRPHRVGADPALVRPLCHSVCRDETWGCVGNISIPEHVRGPNGNAVRDHCGCAREEAVRSAPSHRPLPRPSAPTSTDVFRHRGRLTSKAARV